MAKILYVDQSPEREEAICRLLGDNGHDVTVVTCAERAMMRVEREPEYDAVVLHLMLRGIDGAELCRWLQNWSSLPCTPRVVFTTPDIQLKLNLEQELPSWLPADVFLGGVWDMQELVEAVEGVLCKRSS